MLCAVPWFFPNDTAKNCMLVRFRKSKSYWKHILEGEGPRQGRLQPWGIQEVKGADPAPRRKGRVSSQGRCNGAEPGRSLYTPAEMGGLDDASVRSPWRTPAAIELFAYCACAYLQFSLFYLDSWTSRHRHDIVRMVSWDLTYGQYFLHLCL